MKLRKRIIRTSLFIVLIIALYFIGVIAYGTFTEYKPEPGSIEKEAIQGVSDGGFVSDSMLTFLTWNIGYSGLGKEMDFFYDGGKAVRAPRNIWDKDFAGVISTLQANDSIDFMLIQEIDQESKRSYFVNQYDSLQKVFPHRSFSFGLNYDVQFVPMPIFKPMGKVYGGVATLAKYEPKSAERYQYPGKFGWPTRIFFLDRCFLTQHYDLANGKQLIVINTHNSAYDETGEIKGQEMQFLKNYVEAEYAKGNYVVVGGDFNQCPPGFQYDTFKPKSGYDGFMPPAMSFDYTPADWLWAYDPYTPTNRHVNTPLNDNTFKTLIDFYLISPNLQLLKIKTIDNGFAYSDHQPVLMTVKLL